MLTVHCCCQQRYNIAFFLRYVYPGLTVAGMDVVECNSEYSGNIQEMPVLYTTAQLVYF